MKKILIFTDYYLPGYKGGGPIKSLSLFTEVMKNDFDIYLVTRDRDMGDSEPYKNIIADSWIIHDGINIYYDSTGFSFETLKKILVENSVDKIYLNSLFSSISLKILVIFKKMKIKSEVIIAPRGELSIGALNIKKHKKTIFLKLNKIYNLYKGVSFHTTSIEETKSVKKYFPRSEVYEIKNLTNTDFKTNSAVKVSGNLNLYFISRITKKKNLYFVLQILKNIKKYNISFRIIGPYEDKKYIEECQKLIEELPLNITVKFEGAIPPAEIVNLIKDDHFFIFPTQGENYGHVIAESFLLTKPVLLSDKTPWTDSVTNFGLGYISTLKEKEKWINIIEEISLFNQRDYEEISKNIEGFQNTLIKDNQIATDEYNRIFNK